VRSYKSYPNGATQISASKHLLLHHKGWKTLVSKYYLSCNILIYSDRSLNFLGSIILQCRCRFIICLTIFADLSLCQEACVSYPIPGWCPSSQQYDLVFCVRVLQCWPRKQRISLQNTEGEYSGLEHEIVPGVVESLKVCTISSTCMLSIH
jgi:hypothetical protein